MTFYLTIYILYFLRESFYYRLKQKFEILGYDFYRHFIVLEIQITWLNEENWGKNGTSVFYCSFSFIFIPWFNGFNSNGYSQCKKVLNGRPNGYSGVRPSIFILLLSVLLITYFQRFLPANDLIKLQGQKECIEMQNSLSKMIKFMSSFFLLLDHYYNYEYHDERRDNFHILSLLCHYWKIKSLNILLILRHYQIQ